MFLFPCLSETVVLYKNICTSPVTWPILREGVRLFPVLSFSIFWGWGYADSGWLKEERRGEKSKKGSGASVEFCFPTVIGNLFNGNWLSRDCISYQALLHCGESSVFFSFHAAFHSFLFPLKHLCCLWFSTAQSDFSAAPWLPAFAWGTVVRRGRWLVEHCWLESLSQSNSHPPHFIF